jgi:hypothetical protein
VPRDAAGQDEGVDAASVRPERLRSHRLSAPAPSLAAAAEHMLATQAQEFWAGGDSVPTSSRTGMRMRAACAGSKACWPNARISRGTVCAEATRPGQLGCVFTVEISSSV